MEEHCYVLSNIRGDFTYLTTCLENVAQLIKKDVQGTETRWMWTGPAHTTVVIMGSTLDRFPNLPQHTTDRAFEEESQVMEFLSRFQQLAQQAGARCEILVGDHDVAQMMGDPQYLTSAVADARQDGPLRRAFMKKNGLRFFHHVHAQILTQWNNYTLVHGGLEAEWWKKYRFRTPDQLNRAFHDWVNPDRPEWFRLKALWDRDSPVRSHVLSMKPVQFREWDRDRFVEQWELPWQHPKFVVADLPVQFLERYSWDVTLHNISRHEGGHIYAARNPLGADDIFYIHNGAADVFGEQGPIPERTPQVLHLVRHRNAANDTLFEQVETLTLSAGDAARYLYTDYVRDLPGQPREGPHVILASPDPAPPIIQPQPTVEEEIEQLDSTEQERQLMWRWQHAEQGDAFTPELPWDQGR